MVLLEAVHEATVNTVGNGFRALMHHRDLWERKPGGGFAVSLAIEEVLRYDSRLQRFQRSVVEPGIEIAGQELRVDDEIGTLFGSAQRDPLRFEDPNRLMSVATLPPTSGSAEGGISGSGRRCPTRS